MIDAMHAPTRFAIALLASVLGCASAPRPAATRPAPVPLRFLEDEYDRALAEARSRGKPIFVESWAAW